MAEIGSVGHSRKISGRAGRNFVVLCLGADERRQFADRVVPSNGADAIEEQVAAGEIAVDVGGTTGGEGAAFGSLEADIPFV